MNICYEYRYHSNITIYRPTIPISLSTTTMVSEQSQIESTIQPARVIIFMFNSSNLKTVYSYNLQCMLIFKIINNFCQQVMGSMQTNSIYIQQNKITSLKQYPRHMITYILSMLACPDCSYMLMHLQCRSNITLMYKIITHMYYRTTDYKNAVQCLSFVRC